MIHDDGSYLYFDGVNKVNGHSGRWVWNDTFTVNLIQNQFYDIEIRGIILWVLNMYWIFKWLSSFAFSFIWITFESFVWGTFIQTLTYSIPSLCGSDLGAWYGHVQLSYYISSFPIRLLVSSNSFWRISIFAFGLYKQHDRLGKLLSFID